ncbi:hypothetical protein [Tellurirhabdus bombi]|uniref:hypothetical protein n=1 Tax=Tellurirhabdus bombi TaxID=2907205 RepID=UPI001F48664F|nr:hypothetical protein [Tellurirhabdus bombi]
MKRILYILGISFLYSVTSLAQSTSPETKQELNAARQDRYPKRFVQVGFIYPLSTNGLENNKVSNNLSFNLLGGYSAALDGAEFGGLVNLEKDYVHGVQFAGILNAVGAEVDGAQFAGIANVVGGPVFGPQFAGVANVVGKTVIGPQFAGITNVAGENTTGAQVAGIANVVEKNTKGVQIAGITNIAESVDGAQIAGILNVAERVKGVQIGLINIAKKVDGTQIGLLSLSQDGYKRFEIWGSDVLHGNVGFKMGGNKKFYNIFTVGATWPTDNKNRWGYGYGLGTNQPLGKRNQISIEAIAYQIHEQGTSWDYLNMLNQARVSFIFPLVNRFALTVTPTFNVQVTTLKTGEGIGTSWVKYDVYDQTFGNTRVRMWPGLNVGLQF